MNDVYKDCPVRTSEYTIDGKKYIVKSHFVGAKELNDVLYRIAFEQAMDMQGGEYMLSLGCTGYNGTDFVVHHRLYEACSLTIVSVKNTVGFYDTNSEVILMN